MVPEAATILRVSPADNHHQSNTHQALPGGDHEAKQPIEISRCAVDRADVRHHPHIKSSSKPSIYTIKGHFSRASRPGLDVYWRSRIVKTQFIALAFFGCFWAGATSEVLLLCYVRAPGNRHSRIRIHPQIPAASLSKAPK